MRLNLVRHGETDSNKAGLALGRADVELNETGRWQAQRLADVPQGRAHRRRLLQPPAPRPGHRQRHRRTPRPGGGGGRRPHRDGHRRDGGPYLPAGAGALPAVPPGYGSAAGAAYEPMPGGERLLDVQERAWQALERICAAPGLRRRWRS